MDYPTIKIDWTGFSGKTYQYEILSIDSIFNAVPGNYIFAKEVSPGYWRPIYIGESGNLKQRLTPFHHKWQCAIRNGATHIHAHVNYNGELVRRTEESDLISYWQPDCNS